MINRKQKLSRDLFLENISNPNCMQNQSKTGVLTIPHAPNCSSKIRGKNPNHYQQKNLTQEHIEILIVC